MRLRLFHVRTPRTHLICIHRRSTSLATVPLRTVFGIASHFNISQGAEEDLAKAEEELEAAMDAQLDAAAGDDNDMDFDGLQDGGWQVRVALARSLLACRWPVCLLRGLKRITVKWVLFSGVLLTCAVGNSNANRQNLSS